MIGNLDASTLSKPKPREVSVTRFQRDIRMLASLVNSSGKTRWAKVFLNNECNLRCPYCAVPAKDLGELPLAHWEKIYDRLRSWGVSAVSILGGEPTLRADLVQHVSALNSRDIAVTLTTNGILLNEDAVRELSDAGLFCLQISLDTLNTHKSKLPKADAEHKFSLLEYAESLGVIPVITSVVTALNIHEILDIARKALRREFYFSCSTYQDLGGEFSRKVEQLRPTDLEVAELFQSLRKLRRQTLRIINTDVYFRNWTAESGVHWRCDPSHDLWIVVDSAGRLLRCHEHRSDLLALDVKDLTDPRWVQFKETTVSACVGCYYHCYHDAEEFRGLGVLKELPVAVTGLKFF